MNRLCGMRCYLAGAMDRVEDLGKGWRDNVSEELIQRGVVVLNPLDKPIDVGIESTENRDERKQWKIDEHYDVITYHMKEVRNVDLAMVDISNFVIVNIDVNVHACGTYEEIGWANRCKKPVLIHVEGGKHETPDWMFAMFPHEMIFGNWDDLIKYMDAVHTGRDTRTFNRWKFFDLAKSTLESLLFAADTDPELNKMIHDWAWSEL